MIEVRVVTDIREERVRGGQSRPCSSNRGTVVHTFLLPRICALKNEEKKQILHGNETGYEQNFCGPTVNVDARSVCVS